MNALLGNNFCFVHFLHSVELPSFLHLHLPNLPKSSLPNHKVKLKVPLPNFNLCRLLNGICVMVLLEVCATRLFCTIDAYFIFSFDFCSQFRQINFETVLCLLKGFLAEGGIAPNVAILFVFVFGRWGHCSAAFS